MEHAHALFFMNKEELTSFFLEVLTRFHQPDNFPYHSQSLEGSLKLYTRSEAAVVLKCTPNTVTKYIKTKKLHATYLNGVYRISETELLNFLQKKSNR